MDENVLPIFRRVSDTNDSTSLVGISYISKSLSKMINRPMIWFNLRMDMKRKFIKTWYINKNLIINRSTIVLLY